MSVLVGQEGPLLLATETLLLAFDALVLMGGSALPCAADPPTSLPAYRALRIRP